MVDILDHCCVDLEAYYFKLCKFMNVDFTDPKMTADLKHKLECVEQLLTKYKV